jgi:hypothetical protein
MVKRQLVSYSYTCDVCGDTITDGDNATRKITWEGDAYAVDVCDEHRTQLSDLLTELKTFVNSGSRASGGRGRRPAAVTASTPRAARGAGGSAGGPGPKRGDLGAVRAWARDQGRPVSARGRVGGDVLAAYDAADHDKPTPKATPELAAEESPNTEATTTLTAAASRAPRRMRAAPAKKAPVAAKKASPKRGDLGAVRAWARETGLKVSERGRITGDVLDAYDAAHNSGNDTPTSTPTRPRSRRPRKAAAIATAS